MIGFERTQIATLHVERLS